MGEQHPKLSLYSRVSASKAKFDEGNLILCAQANVNLIFQLEHAHMCFANKVRLRLKFVEDPLGFDFSGENQCSCGSVDGNFVKLTTIEKGAGSQSMYFAIRKFHCWTFCLLQ